MPLLNTNQWYLTITIVTMINTQVIVILVVHAPEFFYFQIFEIKTL